MNYNDLTTKQFEDMAEHAYNDKILKEEFIKGNYSDFNAYCEEHGVTPSEPRDYSEYYLESRDDEFLEFAFDYYRSLGSV